MLCKTVPVPFFYSVSNAAGETGVIVSKEPESATPVTTVRTHGNAFEGNAYSDNNFSQRDIIISQKKSIDGYVATSNASLKHYVVKSNETKMVSTNVPRDPKDKTRTNTISPLSFSKMNLRTIWLR